jgi:hypothetical protein
LQAMLRSAYSRESFVVTGVQVIHSYTDVLVNSYTDVLKVVRPTVPKLSFTLYPIIYIHLYLKQYWLLLEISFCDTVVLGLGTMSLLRIKTSLF